MDRRTDILREKRHLKLIPRVPFLSFFKLLIIKSIFKEMFVLRKNKRVLHRCHLSLN